MSVEKFFKLKEYDSLSKVRFNHLKALKEQDDRLYQLNEKRQNTMNELEQVQKEARDLQQNMFEFEKKIDECELQIKRLSEMGSSDEKIQSFSLQAQVLENNYFSLMSKYEVLNTQASELKTFLNGLELSFKEISEDVKAEKEKDQTGLTHVDLRLSLLLDELPSDFKLVLEKTLAKKLAIGPFTRTDSGSCYFCKAKLSKIEESEIDIQQLLKTCKMCQRIFLPYGS